MNQINLLPYYAKLVCYAAVIIAAGTWTGFYFLDAPLNTALIATCKASMVIGLQVAIFCKEKFEEERNDILRLRAAIGSLSLLGAFLFTHIISPNTDLEHGVSFFSLGIMILFVYHLGFQVSKRIRY